MVVISNGNTEHFAHALRKIFLFLEKKAICDCDLIECFKQIKQQRLLLSCVPISELSSYTVIMDPDLQVLTSNTQRGGQARVQPCDGAQGERAKK